MTSQLRAFLARHLFSYLAVVVAAAIGASILFARDELTNAWNQLDRWIVVPVIGLTLVNYGWRFLKWQQLLAAVGVRVPVASSARIYFACFAMVVTPARMGEFYKAVFLRRLHGISVRRTAPVLVVERITDALAILALASLYVSRGHAVPWAPFLVVVLAVFTAAALRHAALRRALLNTIARVPRLRSRREAFDQMLEHNQSLLAPGVFAPALTWSVLGWLAEGIGMLLLLRGLGEALAAVDAVWIYAVGTVVGNVTFLPGGLGTTEASLVALLRNADVTPQAALATTILVRAATLWFAVLLGLLVTAIGHRQLHWREVQEEAAREPTPERDYS